ncbi:DUF3159 domain-containing protein [Catellatospora bangladeshensis]|uniref:DUF3159 domain-containing protein n=1 Tax=Catellatospora bangladeshensis TaxID=310355 RepID=A0A8J3JBP7_9ACTN|nr:DUF3159 domain-containing protein [Catellatospora bangladeshensis]GIF81902.1 hypothetical protein Cba03nite_32510 [Catellatospora bangladeshensis]
MTTTRPDPAGESFADLLGGRRAAIDATLGPLAFGIGFAAAGQSLEWGVGAAIAVSTAVGGWRLLRGDKFGAVLLGLLGVVVAALIALYTGRPEDFFFIRVATNAASALCWAISIALRWPLLGVVVGGVLGQRGSWRRDPALLRAYSRASWIWVLQYVVRLAVWLPLYWSGQVEALSITTAALTWPLVAACLAVSWYVMRRSLPAGHPGLRHPALADEPANV